MFEHEDCQEGIRQYVNNDLNFRLTVKPDGSGNFQKDGKFITFPSPDEDLLGTGYQNVRDLGFKRKGETWRFANATHELLHVWFCYQFLGMFSPNHAMLLGFQDTPIEDCDREEMVITGLQVFLNTGFLPTESESEIKRFAPYHNIEDILTSAWLFFAAMTQD